MIWFHILVLLFGLINSQCWVYSAWLTLLNYPGQENYYGLYHMENKDNIKNIDMKNIVNIVNIKNIENIVNIENI